MLSTKKAGMKNWVLWGAVSILAIALPFVAPEFWTYILTEILCYCIFALGYNIVLGYGGMIGFGHAGFYGAGAYAVAILLTKTKVSLWVALVMAPLLASLLGLIIGVFVVRLRAFYLGILTLAFGQLIWSLIFKWYDLTGGENGISGVPIPRVINTTNNLYFLALAVAAGCIYTIYRIVYSPFGRTLLAARENPQRMGFIGINLFYQRLTAFVISTFFAGLGGGMHAVFVKGAYPDMADWVKSGEVLIICMLGGIHTFFGPLLGVALLISMHTVVGGLTTYWPLILGSIFVLVVFFLPRGVVGYIEDSSLLRRFGRHEK